LSISPATALLVDRASSASSPVDHQLHFKLRHYREEGQHDLPCSSRICLD
jgi:hypothetical protein